MGFSIPTFVFELVNFLVFLWLLRRILYVPLEKAVAARRDARAAADDRLAKLRAEGLRLEAEQASERARLALDSERIVAEARADAERQRAAVLRRADEEAQDRERREAERRSMLERDVQRKLSSQALGAARRATRRLLASLELSPLDASLTEALLSGVRARPDDERPRAGDSAEVRLAHPVDDARRKWLVDELGRALGTTIDPLVVSDPELLAGAVFTIGDDVFDASLSARVEGAYREAAGQLEEARGG